MATKWVEIVATIAGDDETKAIGWLLVDADFKEEADQLRASVHDTPFGFVAATRTATFGPYRYRESAMEIAENTSRD